METPIREPKVRLSAGDRRSQLLSVATAVFAEHGFASTTMDDIAHGAGVTKPVLYQHFPSKRALYQELLSSITTDLSDAIGKATAVAETPRDQVLQGFTAFFAYVAAHNHAFLLLYDRSGWHEAGAQDPVLEIEDALIDRVDPLIDAGLAPLHRKVLAAAVVSMAEGVARRWLIGSEVLTEAERSARSEGLARAAALLAWGGLRGVQPNLDGASERL